MSKTFIWDSKVDIKAIATLIIMRIIRIIQDLKTRTAGKVR